MANTQSSNPSGVTGSQDQISQQQLQQQASSGTGYSVKFTQGWWMTVGVVTAMLLGNVPYLGPLLFGILGLALLYQISQLVQGQ